MIDIIIAFCTGYLVSWPALVAFVLLGSIFEANQAHGWAIFTGIISAIVAYVFFHLAFLDIIVYAIFYLIAGFVWSFWRYKRFVDSMLETITNSTTEYGRDFTIRHMHPSNNLSKITTWVIVWPFSIIENGLGDIIKLIQTFITKVFKGVYNKIYESAISKIPAIDN